MIPIIRSVKDAALFNHFSSYLLY